MNEPISTLYGRTISTGFGEGTVFEYHDVLAYTEAFYDIDESEVRDELNRFELVFNQISEDLAELVESVKREISRELSAVFKAHIAFLHDPSLKTEVQREIKKELVSAENAVKKVFLWWEQRFRLSESEIANQKADDIRDLARRLLLGLEGIETPAAALNTQSISHYADFMSFGTNDLTQYAFAADRENSSVADYFNDTHDVIFQLMKLATQGAPHLPFSVCGELVGYPDYTERVLYEIGVRSLSVVPPLIPLIKEAVRSVSGRIVRESSIPQGGKSYE